MQWLTKQWDLEMLYAYPDERGGGAAVADEEDADGGDDPKNPDYLVVDGQRIPTSQVLDDHKNKSNWQKKLTEDAERVARQRDEVSELAAKLIDKAAREERKTGEGEPDVDAQLMAAIEALPDPVDDPKGHQKGLFALLKKNNELAVGQALKAAEASDRKVAAESSANQTASRVAQANETLIELTIDEEFGGDLSGTERTALMKQLSGLRGEEDGKYVTLNNGQRIFQYSKAAVRRAARLVDSLYQRELSGATAKARREGQTARDRGRKANDGDRRTGSPTKPGPNASISDKLAWLNSLPEAEMEREAAKLSDKERDAILEEIALTPE